MKDELKDEPEPMTVAGLIQSLRDLRHEDDGANALGAVVVMSGDSAVLGDGATAYDPSRAPKVQNASLEVGEDGRDYVVLWPDRDGRPE